jgi:hypothetical protein
VTDKLSLIEIMARAAAPALGPDAWEDYGPASRAELLNAMSAALRAMMEHGPTPIMMQAALAELSDATVDEPKAAAWDAVRTHKAMLRAELGEDTP